MSYLKKFIREQTEKLVNEFYGNDMVYLSKYLNLTDEEKVTSLPFEYSFLLYDFMEEENIFDSLSNKDKAEIRNIEFYEQLELIEDKYPSIFNEFGKWLFRGVENRSLSISDAEYPAWSFFDNPKLIKNTWLVHFTSYNKAKYIKQEGFTKGVSDMTKLGLTTHLSDFEKAYGGYNFAYTISDAKKYAYASHGRGLMKYGDTAVMFMGSGIRIYHGSDEEYQAIFYGNTAKNFVIISNYDGEWMINSKDGRVVYKNEDIEKVFDWVEKNYMQYKNII
jgi:hypothetical protein